MTKDLKIVGRGFETKKYLKARIEELQEERKASICEAVTKTLIYQAEMGATKVMLDELPGVRREDLAFVAGWLEGEGFTLSKPRFGGRTVVELSSPGQEE